MDDTATDKPSFEDHAYHNYSASTYNSIRNYGGGDHERAVNYPVQWFLENYEDHAWDMVLKEVPVVHTESTATGDKVGNDIVDADVGFIDLDNDRLMVYQMKRSNSHIGEARGQYKDIESLVAELRETLETFGWDYLGEVEAATNIPEAGANPLSFRHGYVYGPPEAREKAVASESYDRLSRYVFGSNIELTDPNILEVVNCAQEMDDLVDADF